MVAVGGVGERADLVNDTDGQLVGLNHNAVNLVQVVLDLGMEGQGALDGGLGVELGREGNLE